MERMKIAGISGSLRKGSYNTATLRAVGALLPDDTDFEIITLEEIEPFNEDVEAEGWPPGVESAREKLNGAAGIIMATPEYNYGISGVLKNAIDWFSRPTGEGPICGKPLTILGASPSKTGTARAQSQLRDAAFYNAMPLLTSSEVLISNAAEKFTDDGVLTDNETREFLARMIEDFIPWVELNRSN